MSEIIVAQNHTSTQSFSSTSNKTANTFDLRKWIEKFRIPVSCTEEVESETCYHLAFCPFNENHLDTAFIVRHKSGSFSAGCTHPECKGKGWRELRQIYEPGCYDSKRVTEKFISNSGIINNVSIFPCTDMGNGQRLAHHHGEELRYCYERKRWYVWDGMKWEVDSSGEVERRAKDVAHKIFLEANATTDLTEQKQLANHALRSQNKSRIDAMIALARSEFGIAAAANSFDRDPWTLNCANGIIDLKTGKLMEHERTRYCTQIAPVIYDLTADCPTWLTFINTITQGNSELRSFLQKAAGYSLTGLTSERCIFIFYGTGKNGKSTFVNTLKSLVGDYGVNVAAESLMVKDTSSIRSDIARLRGVRFVSSAETEQGKRLAEGLIKGVTGDGDTLTARFLYGEDFDFIPTFKIFLSTNHKPVIRGSDEGIWDRIRLVPFTWRCPEDQQDPYLKDKLQQELPGILQWAIQGCLLWQKEGLKAPSSVITATQTYRSEMDVIGSFLRECCTLEEGKKVTCKEFYQAYTRWCEETGETPWKQKTLTIRLQEQYGVVSKKGAQNVSYLHNITLVIPGSSNNCFRIK